MKVDFGEITVPTSGGRKRKVYCMAPVLAHSRFKYAEWSDQPFTTARLTAMLRRCFEYICGMPQELVFDQDKLVAVSENHGDILYTEEFERLKQTLRFKVYLCRKGDPGSKGKVESTVKYVKYNFAKHRLFTTLQD
ncbi:MAG: DDE-type integrase/transposase/recombinase [Negativicutes bacterium]|nr:DDE-type integrase/transposase/recombinase [Negativicutes bacterium]